MTLLLFITKIGRAEIRQDHNSKLYNVKYTDNMGNIRDVGNFSGLDQARLIANKYRTGAYSRHLIEGQDQGMP
ncbi:hypothetical protein PITCH_A1670021 [uncultured Desulfobacterium sp.]|uniref:Uncharacterized protein n=1 Tax=uncultured Desulfobacterium sp. TaxID=201089 RepID=A0A445MUE3_9BACT|nr:hypothetical protein PITCH_A1670021 [uncultured Desulfobacterium sp.]